MKVTEIVKGRSEYISIIIVPLKYTGKDKCKKTGKQQSFQLRNFGAKDVTKIKEIFQYIITSKGVMDIYDELKKKKNKWVCENDLQDC